MSPRPALAISILLLATYILLAYFAVNTKSATYDEPLSVVSSYAVTELHDYRLDFEHPPLWKYLAWLPNLSHPFHADFTTGSWTHMEDPPNKWAFTHAALFNQPSIDLHSFISRSRAIMLLPAILLATLIAFWSWQLAGPIASVASLFLFCLDPNFLAHGPLVKNDVAVSLLILSSLHATWRLGQRVTLARILLLGFFAGIALSIKLSAITIAPLVIILLLCRCFQRSPWIILNRPRTTLPPRLLTVPLIGLSSLAISVAILWASYGFRYSVSPDPSYHIDFNAIVRQAALKHFYSLDPVHRPSESKLASWNPGLITHLTYSLNHLHALPEPWLAAILFTQRTSAGEPAYLMGHIYHGGHFAYFPIAILVKTPETTLIVLTAAILWTLFHLRKNRSLSWNTLCLALPAILLLVASLFSKLDLGIRYLLPLYPLLFIGIGIFVARAWNLHPRYAKPSFALLSLVLIAETAFAYPNFISFFNSPSLLCASPLWWLGDSNLDWGQDLPALASWQKQHPGERLAFAYFGMDDPASYGIVYQNLSLGYQFGGPQSLPGNENCTIAVSATILQGIYSDIDVYRSLREFPPAQVLNHSIYLYNYAPPP